MEALKQSAKAFKRLLNKEYLMVITRKSNSVQFKLLFEEWDFKHLAGIHKLTDTDLYKMPAANLFNNILRDKITESDLKASIYFNEIKERMENLKNLESYLDNNMLVFKWDRNKGGYSKVSADYVLKENIPDDKKAYVFLREKFSLGTTKKLKVEEIKKKSAISFFLEKRDLTENQVSYTLVKNEKIDKIKNTRTVLYDLEEVKKERAAAAKAKAMLQEQLKAENKLLQAEKLKAQNEAITESLKTNNPAAETPAKKLPGHILKKRIIKIENRLKTLDEQIRDIDTYNNYKGKGLNESEELLLAAASKRLDRCFHNRELPSIDELREQKQNLETKHNSLYTEYRNSGNTIKDVSKRKEEQKHHRQEKDDNHLTNDKGKNKGIGGNGGDDGDR